MHILVMAATAAEIPALMANHKNVDTVISGVGVPAALYALQKKIQQQPYDVVIQAGIAGTVVSYLPMGEVVLVSKDTFADIGMEEAGVFTPLHKTIFTNSNDFPYTDGWLINDGPYIHNSTLPLVKGVTINKVSDSTLQAQQLLQHFSPEIESMEGAALHYVCLQQKIPFMQIRAISNLTGVRDKSKWEIKKAIENLNYELMKLIEILV